MKDCGTGESAICEPDYLEIQLGDTVRFIRERKNHNVASITKLSLAGCSGFTGKVDEEAEATYNSAGFYGIKCTSYYAQGTVMLIRVGDALLPESHRVFRAPGIADRHFQGIYAHIDKR